jgi:ABC-type uncharacterized transport system substrate-binding protein
MRRREFLAALGGAALWLPVADAQVSPRRPLIAWLSGGGQPGSTVFVDAFLQGMREHGYVEGRNFDIVYRYADGYVERLPALAEELIHLHPSLILAPASGPAVAARKTTSTIPIVTPALADAVHLGLIASESRPGGNVTGIAPLWSDPIAMCQRKFLRRGLAGEQLCSQALFRFSRTSSSLRLRVAVHLWRGIVIDSAQFALARHPLCPAC